MYRSALELIQSGVIDAEALLTHRYDRLERLQEILERDMASDDYLKGVVRPNDSD